MVKHDDFTCNRLLIKCLSRRISALIAMTGEQALLLHLTNIFHDRLTSTLLFAQLHVSAGFLRREALLTASYISILDSTPIVIE